MIGNDIVDLVLAKKESNWKRKGFLNKIFTTNEQSLIINSQNPDLMVWNLWTRKEAAYKIYNRKTEIRGYFPIKLECLYDNDFFGSVFIEGNVYHTITTITDEYVHSIATEKMEDFENVKFLNSTENLLKRKDIPYLFDQQSKKEKPVSISHHGRFFKAVTIR